MFTLRPTIKRQEIVDSLPKLSRLQRKMMALEEFAFDTETNTLKVLGENSNFSLVGISISWGEYDNYYIPVGHLRYEDLSRQLDLEDVVDYLKEPFEREDVRIIGQNIKFDLHVMARVGIVIKTKDIWDTMILSWLCDENTPNGLKDNSKHFLGVAQTHFKEVTDLVPVEIKKEFGLKANSRATFDMALIEDSAPYALADSFYTWELYRGFILKVEDEQMEKVYVKMYMPFLRTLFEMEECGVTVDTSKLEDMSVSIKEDMEQLEYEMFDLAGIEFNPSSSAQLSELLFGYSAEPKEVDLSKQPKIVQRMFEEGDEDALNGRGLFTQTIEGFRDRKALFKMTGNPKIQKASFGFPVMSKTAKGAPQTNADVFWKLSQKTYKTKRKLEGIQLCKLLLQYKRLDKLRSAFIEGLSEQLYDDGKAHPSFNIIGTDSGRISCSAPNLQQLPKAEDDDAYQIRSLFIGSQCLYDPKKQKTVAEYYKGRPTNGYEVRRKKIVALDFANLEMRVLAHFSEDENLLNMFANNEDTHGSTAVNMFELPCTASEVKKQYPHLRQAAKVLNFLLMYGGGAFTLYNSLKSDHYNPIDLADQSYLDMYGVKTGEDVAQVYIDKYFSTYSGVSTFIRNQKRFAHRNGYVYSLLKRKRRLPDINSHDHKMVSYCERLSVNSAVQGSAADITMSAQNRVNNDPWFKENFINMIIQVHDELVLECPEELVDKCIEKVKFYMEHPFGDNVELNLPMVADFDSGHSYQEAK